MSRSGRWARDAFGFVKDLLSQYGKHHGSQVAAALAYFSLFAVAPLLVIATSVAGFVCGRAAVRGEVLARASRYVDPRIAAVLQSILARASSTSSGVIALVVGTFFLLLGAIGAFLAMQQALDEMWGVEPRPGLGIRTQMSQRLPAFLLVLAVGLLLVLSLLAAAALATLARSLHAVPFSWVLVQALDYVAFFGIVTLAFAFVYKYLPDARIGWGTVWLGAAVTSFLFIAGQVLFGLYLSFVSFSSTFGAAGSVIALLVWLDVSAQIFLLGAEVTQMTAVRRGKAIEPARNARPAQRQGAPRQGGRMRPAPQ